MIHRSYRIFWIYSVRFLPVTATTVAAVQLPAAVLKILVTTEFASAKLVTDVSSLHDIGEYFTHGPSQYHGASETLAMPPLAWSCGFRILKASVVLVHSSAGDRGFSVESWSCDLLSSCLLIPGSATDMTPNPYSCHQYISL